MTATGNLTSVTKPLGNASGAPAGSYTTKYTYDTFGDQLTSTDPLGKRDEVRRVVRSVGVPADDHRPAREHHHLHL